LEFFQVFFKQGKIFLQQFIGGVMEETPGGSGHFVSATLRPVVKISAGDPTKALKLHHEAHKLCFIANSVNFPVGCEAEIV